MKKKGLTVIGRIVIFIPAVLVYFLSTSPTYTFNGEDDAGLIVGMKHITDKAHICSEEEVRLFLEKEAKNPRKHLRKRARACGSRERVPLGLVLRLDDKELINTEYEPSGVHDDGNTFIYKKFIVSAGEHRIRLSMRDSKKENNGEFDYHLDKKIYFKKRQVIVIGFDPLKKDFKLSAGG